MNRLVLLLVFFGSTVFSSSDWTGRKLLNIYIWGNYLSAEVVREFTKETGIKVNVTECDNNETMFIKLRMLKKVDYDLVMPSSYFVDRMRKLKMLHPLDKTKLSNLVHIYPDLLNKPFDPGNRYSVPYFWGTTGILVNAQYLDPKSIKGWKDFWQPQYHHQLMILNDLRDVFSMALLKLGYDANDSDPKHVEQAYLELRKLLPNVKIFSVDTIPNIYVDEDVVIGMAWSGDGRIAMEENSNLKFIYPEEGFALWLDSFVIIKDAPHVDNAYRFLNFILRPEIAAKLAIAFGYSTANKTAAELVKQQKNTNLGIDEPKELILKKGVFQLDLGEEVMGWYRKYWERLKIGA